MAVDLLFVVYCENIGMKKKYLNVITLVCMYVYCLHDIKSLNICIWTNYLLSRIIKHYSQLLVYPLNLDDSHEGFA